MDQAGSAGIGRAGLKLPFTPVSIKGVSARKIALSSARNHSKLPFLWCSSKIILKNTFLGT